MNRSSTIDVVYALNKHLNVIAWLHIPIMTPTGGRVRVLHLFKSHIQLKFSLNFRNVVGNSQIIMLNLRKPIQSGISWKLEVMRMDE